MLHIPILRHGVPYRAWTCPVPHYRTHEPFVEISQRTGLIRRDLRPRSKRGAAGARGAAVHAALAQCRERGSFRERHAVARRGDAISGGVRRTALATTVMPHVLVRRNMQKIAGVMTRCRPVTRTDAWPGLRSRRRPWRARRTAISFYPRTDSLGIVLPSNSPGVHSLWFRLHSRRRSFSSRSAERGPFPHRAGVHRVRLPPAAFSYYPADHAGAGETPAHG